MAGVVDFFILNSKILSTHLDQISHHINSTNHNIYSYDQISKIIINLGKKKGDNNDKSSPKLTDLQNYLSMIIFGTPKNDVYQAKRNELTRKMCTYYVNSSSSLFLC